MSEHSRKLDVGSRKRVGIKAIRPLSPVQHLMLSESVRTTRNSREDASSETTSTGLVSQFEFQLERPVRPDVFRDAWQVLVDRHESLRTSFVWKNPKPLQIIRERAKLDFRSHGEVDGGSHALSEIKESDLREGISTTSPSLMRVLLINSNGTKPVFVWTCHHLILDRWCIPQMLDQLAAEYKQLESKVGMNGAIREAADAKQRPVPQFGDYVVWLGKRNEQAARSFWESQLTDLSRQPSASPTTDGSSSTHLDESRFMLSASQVAALKSIALQAKISSGNLFSAAFSVTIAKLYKTDDVVFATTAAARPAEVEKVDQIIGPFSNTVPFRLQFNGSDTFGEVLKRSHSLAQSRTGFEHESIADIVAWVPELASRLDVLFLFQPTQSKLRAASDLIDMNTKRVPPVSTFPITVSVHDGMEIEIEFLIRGKGTLAKELPTLFERTLQNLSRCGLEGRVFDEPTSRSPGSAKAVAKAKPIKSSTPKAIREEIRGIWEEVLGLEHVDEQTSFFDLGGRSFMLPMLAARIEQLVEVPVTIDKIFSSPTIDQFVRRIEQGDLSQKGLVVPFNEFGANTPVFWAPGDDGEVGGVWTRLGPDQPSYGLRLPGWDGQDDPLLTVGEIAKRLNEELRAYRPNGPYALGGFCFGATLAFEMARQLAADGTKVSKLVLIDAYRAGAGYRDFSWRPRTLMSMLLHLPVFLGDLATWPAKELKIHCERNLRIILSGIRRRTRTNVNVANEYSKMVDSSLHAKLRRACIQAFLEYAPQQYDGDTALFRTRVQPLICSHERSMGWRAVCEAIRVVDVPGNHSSMQKPPHSEALCAELAKYLSR